MPAKTIARYTLTLIGPQLENRIETTRLGRGLVVEPVGLGSDLLREVEENVTKLLPDGYGVSIRPQHGDDLERTMQMRPIGVDLPDDARWPGEE